MVQMLGFGIGLKEVEYTVILLFVGILCINVFLTHPDNVFDAITATGEVFFPTGEDVAYCTHNFVTVTTTTDVTAFIWGLVTGSLSALILIIKGLIAIAFIYTVIFQCVLPAFAFFNNW